MPPIVQIQVQRAPGDCCLCALSMYLGIPYEDLLGAAVSTTRKSKIHRVGMFTRDMKQTAAKLGVKLRLRRSFDIESDEGVLALDDGENQHAVLLMSGRIFDGDSTVWDPGTFFQKYKYRPISLLVRDED